ncbi:hypothetical protein ACT91Q_03530 [Brevibacillus thermoruber]|jgi:hypothetical protein|uniref:hypothetical protein n=1 Tax=Brevibacillus TaxID=55080 RepID=UPI000556C6BE|nr:MULTISPECIES: hypothetical protein [Brevibacillus]UYZ11580.1 hypothetical protein A6764_11970 [Brevibacillus sp. WF146]
MSSLDLLERKLLRILAETEPVRLKRRWIQSGAPVSEEEQRQRISLLLRRLDSLPEAKQQEVRELLKWYNG